MHVFYKILALFVIILSIVAITYYGWKGRQASVKHVVKIGGLMPAAHGDLAVNRKKMMNGMEMAKEDLLAKYPGKLRIDIDYQDGCFPQDSIPAVQKFIHDGVSIIGCSFCLFGHLPILPLTEGNKIITWNTAANPDKALNLHYAFQPMSK